MRTQGGFVFAQEGKDEEMQTGTLGQYLLSGLALMLGLTVAVSAADPHVWGRWEQSLTSSKTYANPYADVAVSVTYTAPGGQTYQARGFWDGGSTFKLRFAFPSPGTWTWKTTCSDTGNTGLHSRSGLVNVTSYSGSNVLYQRGLPAVSANKRYLTHADGTPFNWMGDTAWVAPLRASQLDWQSYVNDRVGKHFTAIQISPASSWGGTQDTSGNAPFMGSGITQWNPAYWQGFEQKVEYANQQGLLILVIGLMEPTTRYPSSADAQLFARNLTARLSGNIVILSPSFDSPYMTLGDDVGAAIDGATPIHLVTQHTGTSLSAAQSYYDKSYLNFCGYQSGHNNGDSAKCAKNAREWGLSLYGRNPFKPVINLEAFYDTNGTTTGMEAKYLGTAKDARSLGYLSRLSGAAGYTYGAYGLWNWQTDASKGYYWSKAMAYPSSTQMKHMHDFFGGFEWWRLEPAHSAIVNQGTDDLTKMVFAKSSDGTLAAAYLPDNAGIALDMTLFAGAVSAKWFDVQTGAYTAISGTVPNNGQYTFNRPASGDWALLLTATAAPTPRSDLRGHWKLDDASGTRATDSSEYAQHGTLMNGPAWTTGQLAGALDCDGVDDRVDIGNPSHLKLTGAMTLAAWVRVDSFSTNGRIVNKQGGSGKRGWSLNVESGGYASFQIASDGSTQAIVNGTSLATGSWVHLAGTYTPGQALKLYINGQLNASLTSGVPTSQYDAPLNVAIGSRPEGACPFDGRIDDVRVYSKVLSDAEIANLAGSTPPPPPPPPDNTNAPRLVVLTDIGGDPDDQQSMVRLMTYSNEFAIEGLIPSSTMGHGIAIHPELIEGIVDAFGQVRDNLLLHATGYPTRDHLRSIIKNGYPNYGTAYIGANYDTDGSNWIISVVDRDDARPVNVVIWGGSRELAQALWRVRNDRTSAQLSAFVAKLRVHAIGDQDGCGAWINQNFPQLFYILDLNTSDKLNSCYRGMYLDGDTSLVKGPWPDNNVCTNHGPMGALYPLDGAGVDGVKEGDTPSWFYFLPRGFNDPTQPGFGGWGGRFASVDGRLYRDQQDTVNGQTSYRATVWRWRPAFQNDFQARMDWCVKSYAQANHNPIAKIAGSLTRTVNSGATVTLDASGSSDPDGNALSFKWYPYREPGTYDGDVVLANATSAVASFVAPQVTESKTIHVILEVKDNGSPNLYAVQRVVVIVNPAAPPPPPPPPPTGLIINVQAKNGKPYVKDTLAVDKAPYIDRTYTIASYPAGLEGAEYIRTANGDKVDSSADLLSFTLTADAMVYVARDDRLTTQPPWMNGFSDTGGDLTVNEGSSTTTYSLWVKSYPAGDVTVGGNAGVSSSSNYLVIGILDSATTTFSALVNFQPATAPVPNGYVADSGAAYGDRGHGLTYGWNVTNNETRDRNVHADQRYDTLDHMQKPSNPNATWEIAVPNGTYRVKLVCGDPSFTNQVNTLQVENVTVSDPDGEDNFDDYDVTVSVSDGRLTVKPGVGASNAKICYVEIVRQ